MEHLYTGWEYLEQIGQSLSEAVIQRGPNCIGTITKVKLPQCVLLVGSYGMLAIVDTGEKRVFRLPDGSGACVNALSIVLDSPLRGTYEVVDYTGAERLSEARALFESYTLQEAILEALKQPAAIQSQCLIDGKTAERIYSSKRSEDWGASIKRETGGISFDPRS